MCLFKPICPPPSPQYSPWSYPVYDASRMEMPDATEDLVEQIGHPFMVQVHVYHLAQAGIHQLHHQIAKRQDGRLKGKTQIKNRRGKSQKV